MRAPAVVVVEAAAKVNVGWHVGPRRDDGFHDVAGMIQTISITDALRIERLEEGPEVEVIVPGRPELDGSTNLAARAAEVVGGDEPVRITIEKAIPVAAGLGGGSADAAAALMGVAMVRGRRIPPGKLLSLGAGIGSDVSAIMRGGLVHASGRGERVVGRGSFTGGHLVLGVTHAGISAGDAYARFDELRPGPDDTLHANALEAAALSLRPELVDRIGAMRDACGVAFVSGSGPTVVGVTVSIDEAQRARDRLSDAFDEVLLATPVDRGVRLRTGA